MTSADESLITPELQDLIGRDGPTGEVAVTSEIVRRVLETIGEQDTSPGGVAPPYVLMAFGADLPLPETSAAPISLVTGDEWTLLRPVPTGARLTVVGRLASVDERFGSRFGHNLVLRTTQTFFDEHGEPVAEAGRGFIRYRPPEQGVDEGSRGLEDADQAVARTAPQIADAGPAPTRILQPSSLAAGDQLPPHVLRPTLMQVVRYCGLTWNFVPFFFDAEEARRAGLPGPIVPGPFKLALITRELAGWLGSAGAVRSVRCAYRRPDRTGLPFTLRAVVSRLADEDNNRVLDCELWTETVEGARSIIGSASLVVF